MRGTCFHYLWVRQIGWEADVQEGEDGSVQAFNIFDKRHSLHTQGECHLPEKVQKQIWKTGNMVYLLIFMNFIRPSSESEWIE